MLIRDVNEYLFVFDGMGVKMMFCVLFFVLYCIDFFVDVNVGRIMVRLGWVLFESEIVFEEFV